MNNKDLQPLINRFQEILPLSNTDIKCLEEFSSIKIIEEKSLYVTQNTICKQMGFVLQGVLKVSKFNSKGQEYIPYFVTPGHFAVDVDSYFNKIHSEENIMALTQCKIVTISKANFDHLEKEIPNFSKIITGIKEKALLEKMKAKSEMLIDDAATKYQKLLKKQPEIIQQVSQSEIALHLGITQYTLSRIKAKK